MPGAQALAAAHPQRLYFPFNLSRGHYGADGQKRAAALAGVLVNICLLLVNNLCCLHLLKASSSCLNKF